MSETYSRQQLYDLVWSGPMREVSKELSLSDNGLRKQCLKAFVPLPPQGYWNKINAGQKPKVTPLPPRPPGVSDTVTVGAWNYLEYNKKLLETEPVAPVIDEPIESLRERVARNIGVVVASKNLSPPHAVFRRQVEDDARRAATERWHTPIFDSPSEKRRLRILQGLFNGLGRLDCDASAQGPEVRTIYIRVGQQNVQITLDKVAGPRRGTAPQANDSRLKLAILGGRFPNGERITWSDVQDEPLEKYLSAIAVEIIVTGELQYREHLQWAYEEAGHRRKKVQKEALEKKLAAERAEQDRIAKFAADQLKRLTDDAQNYQQAEAIRTFVERVGRKASGNVPSDVVGRWREWALGQADALDPIRTNRIWKAIDAA